MKKTLMVISFALCASFAFAQTNTAIIGKSAKSLNVAREANSEKMENSAGYTGSIFTKEGNTYFTCEFTQQEQTASTFTTGIVGINEIVDGTAIPRHTNQGEYGQWRRIPDSLYFHSEEFADIYPAINYAFFNHIKNNFMPETRDNGFMLMSMIDSYGGWGGDNDPGIYDGWIRFAAVNLSTCELPMISVYQMYRKFNYDKTYIDYSVDNGATWFCLEYNVRGVDIDGNSSIRGTKRITLPRALAGQSAVTFRIRYVDESDDANGGYFYLVDDFSVIDAPDNHLRFTSCQYFEGFYQMMPQGLQLPVVWAADFYNDGNLPQTNAVGKVFAMASGEDATLLAQKSLGTVVAVADSLRTFVIDPLGYYDSTASGHGWTYWFDSSYKTGEYACLPTSQLGANYFFSDVNTTYYNTHIYDTLGTFDTLRYTVNYGTITDAVGQTHPAGIWARDHGVLTYNGDGVDNGAGNHYTPGMVGTSTWSDDWQSTTWNQAGYGTMVTYVTGRTVPADWRVLGVEMVASTTPGFQGEGATIVPILWKDSTNESGEIEAFVQVDNGTGIDYYTIKESDVDYPSNLTYKTINQGYPTIRILFPNQPRIDSNTVYHIGYRLAEDAEFAVAECRTNFMRNDSVIYFSNTPGMTDYKSILTKYSGHGNWYSVWNCDMYGGSATLRPFNTDVYPMIRMIVGPSYHVNKYKVSWECDNEDMGYFTNDNGEVICGLYDSVAEGYPLQFIIQPEVGYAIDKVTINGVETDLYTIHADVDGQEYGILQIESVLEELNFKCYFKENTGIDPIASHVAMKLQPNPATSNVFVSLKGVTGNVNMSLIDMSGRVVSTSQFVAENGANINVSNLAKGAYFVRITNNNFTKIEKLIVR